MALNVRGSDSLYWKTGLDNSGLQTGATQAKGILAGLTSQISAMDVFAAVSIGAAFHIKAAIQECTLLAARYETLGVVMNIVGKNAGYSADEMNAFQKELEKTGISMIESRQSLARMIQAHLDLTKASKLARVAQDAAVIGNINSSEAFQRIVYGIQSGQVEILRTIGLNVNFQNSYQKVAETLNKTANDLTETEKAQIRMNVVMDAGIAIAGSYEAAMGTAGKQMLSLQRYVDNLKVLLGQAFTPALSEIVEAATSSIIGMNGELLKSSESIKDWGNSFRLVLIQIEAEVMRVAMLIDKIGGTMSAAAGLFYSPGAAMGWENSQKQAEKFAKYNVAFEDKYNKTLKDLENLAAKYDALVYASGSQSKNVAAGIKAVQDKNKKTPAEMPNISDITENQKELADIEDRFAKERIDAITNDFAKRRALIEYNYKVESEKLKGNTAALAILKKERDFLLSGVGKEEKQSQMGAFDFYTVSNKYRADIKNQYSNVFDENTKKLQEKTDEDKRLYELDTQYYDINLVNKKNLDANFYKNAIKRAQEYAKLMAKTYGINSKEYQDAIKDLMDKTSEFNEFQKAGIEDIKNSFSELGELVGQYNKGLGESISKVSELISAMQTFSGSATITGSFSGLLGIVSSVSGIMNSLFGSSENNESVYDQIKKQLEKKIDKLTTEIIDIIKVTRTGVEIILANGNTWIETASSNLEAYITEITGLERRLTTLKSGRQTATTESEIAAVADQITELQSKYLELLANYQETLTGTTAESIADSITDGFSQGMNSAEVFADNFNDLMKNAILSAFKSAIITEQLNAFYEQFAMLSQSGLTKEEIDILRNNFTAALNNIQITWDAISEIANESGINLISGSKSSTNSLSGAIQGITESTAGVLEGQLNNLMMNVIKITDKSDLSLNALREIRDNTYPLKGIYSKSDLSLNALIEIRDAGYYLDDIYNINLNINNNLSIIKSVGLDNLAANKETAVNTRYLKLIDDKLSALNSGTNVRALGV